MAGKRRTWLWVLVAVFGLGVLGVMAMAGAGMYFVSKHVHAGPSSSADAFRAFDKAAERFKDVKPMFELDEHERPRQLRQFGDMPTSKSKVENMWILAWDPDRERLVKVSLPFWLLKLGRQKIDIMNGGFDIERMQLDMNELQRVGPILLFDHRSSSGERVLIWTQ
jgi:hypothetical protein